MSSNEETAVDVVVAVLLTVWTNLDVALPIVVDGCIYIMNKRKEYGNVVIAMEKDRTRSV